MGDDNARLNRWLDALPGPRLSVGGRRLPAFAVAGVAGYYVALAVAVAGALALGLSLVVMLALAAACALSFFAWAWLRRLVGGEERYVLLEHVWAAELACAGVLRALGLSPWAYLDVVSVALCAFLACGRIGCLLAGCCYGHPSRLGVRYGAEHVRDGFPAPLAGVRLLPVQLVEALALVVIAVAGAALWRGAPGRALVWVLAAYAIVRFALEAARLDPRPSLFGLTQARWMALVDLAVAVAVVERGQWRDRARLGGAVAVGGVLLAAWLVRWLGDRRRRLLSRRHVAELRALVQAQLDAPEGLRAQVTARGVSVAASRVSGGVHVSLLVPGGDDRWLVCQLAARAWPSVDPAAVLMQPSGLWHCLVGDRPPALDGESLALALYARSTLAPPRETEMPGDRAAAGAVAAAPPWRSW
jgi:prolipoprotein diacylglyceryltransferase